MTKLMAIKDWAKNLSKKNKIIAGAVVLVIIILIVK